jgi:hypothetical protein
MILTAPGGHSGYGFRRAAAKKSNRTRSEAKNFNLTNPVKTNREEGGRAGANPRLPPRGALLFISKVNYEGKDKRKFTSFAVERESDEFSKLR